MKYYIPLLISGIILIISFTLAIYDIGTNNLWFKMVSIKNAFLLFGSVGLFLFCLFNTDAVSETFPSFIFRY
jgi:hypothetical protein